MEKEVEKSFTKVVEQVESYLGIRRLVKEENYAGALDKVKSSPLSSSTKEHLVNALETDDKDDIEWTFDKIDTRMAKALCWDSWGRHLNPWRGWKPGSAKEYDPNDPHFNPMHPPKGYPQELLESEFADIEVSTREGKRPDGSTGIIYTIKRK